MYLSVGDWLLAAAFKASTKSFRLLSFEMSPVTLGGGRPSGPTPTGLNTSGLSETETEQNRPLEQRLRFTQGVAVSSSTAQGGDMPTASLFALLHAPDLSLC